LRKFKKDTRVIANNHIRYDTIRVTLPDGESRIMNKHDALNTAGNAGLDLVLIADNADPPVCKIVNLNKFLYEKKQREKEAKKKQRENAVEQKEIRLGINIEQHDLETKVKHAEKFLKKGNVVTLTVVLKGRERSKHDLAVGILKKFAGMLEIELGQITRSGNRVSVRITQ